MISVYFRALVVAVVVGSVALATDPAPLRAGSTRVDNGPKIRMIYCPPGKFMMGSPKTDKDANENEMPQEEVVIEKGFWLGKTEVTQAEWFAVMATRPWRQGESLSAPKTLDGRFIENEKHPATGINWVEANEFCKKLTEQELQAGRIKAGDVYRLPNEEEWEYACRAGTKTPWSFGSNKAKFESFGWSREKSVLDGGQKVRWTFQPVGKFKPNAWGFLDMHGNVSELCNNDFLQKRVGGPISTRDEDRFSKGHKTNRGGSHGSEAIQCRSAARLSCDPSTRTAFIGFRVALITAGDPQ